VTDTQTLTGAIVGAAGLIAEALRRASGMLARAQDRGSAALVKTAESNATLAVKFDALTLRFEGLTTRFDRLVEVLLATGGVGVGLSAVARLGRAPTSPMLPTILAPSEVDDAANDDE
jgi:hypothetical protein